MKTYEFRSRPVYVSAIKVTLENYKEVAVWCGGVVSAMYNIVGVSVPTAAGYQRAWLNEWVIRNDQDEFIVMYDGVFNKTYEVNEVTEEV